MSDKLLQSGNKSEEQTRFVAPESLRSLNLFRTAGVRNPVGTSALMPDVILYDGS